MNTTLTIGTSAIRQRDGLYSLNDLHRASGGAQNHRPNQFLRLDQTRALIEEIDQCADSRTALQTVNGGRERGSYACRELVIAYAAWISAAFHLKVIRVFLDTQVRPPQVCPPQERLECQPQAKQIGRGLKEAITEAVKEAVSQTQEKPPFPSSDRWLVSFRFGKERIDAVEWDEAILKYTDLPRLIAAPDNRLEPDLLVAIGKACFGRLARLHGRHGERTNFAGGVK